MMSTLSVLHGFCVFRCHVIGMVSVFIASIRDYMLEKCRVVGRNEDCGEGNFHIFYGLFAGLSQQQKQDLFLLKPESYGYDNC